MPTATEAYQAVAVQTANPRKLEADLLLRAASRLKALHDDRDHSRSEFEDALFFNRRLWSLLLAAVTNSGNPLPRNVRQNVANLGLFVLKQTLTLMADPNPDHLRPLIHINRELAAGLMSRAA